MKVALLADLHFGIKKSDLKFQESQLRFYKNQFVPELKEKNIDTIIICGDVFDTRQSVNVQTENVVIDLFKETLKDFNIHIVVGNHDLYTTTSTDINSLKALDLLPHITVYERPTEIKMCNKSIMMLPWITKYSDFDETIDGHYDYCFAHLDTIGSKFNDFTLSDSGLTIKQVFDKFTHTYTGHYHARSRKLHQENSLTYIGAPYQLTRIDKHMDRGYIVLDLDTDTFEWVNNNESIRFYEYVYPNVDRTKVKGNVIDIKIPFQYQNDTKKIYELIRDLDKLEPAYPINSFNESKPENESEEDIEIDTNQFNLINMFRAYVDQITTSLNKDELYNELLNLYNTFKGIDS